MIRLETRDEMLNACLRALKNYFTGPGAPARIGAFACRSLVSGAFMVAWVIGAYAVCFGTIALVWGAMVPGTQPVLQAVTEAAVMTKLQVYSSNMAVPAAYLGVFLGVSWQIVRILDRHKTAGVA